MADIHDDDFDRYDHDDDSARLLAFALIFTGALLVAGAIFVIRLFG